MASNASNTGGYDCKFVETPPDKLVCQICLLVAHTPHQVMCCGRVYCETCLDEHKKHSSTCPNCRETGQNFPDIRGQQEIKSLMVMCSNTENGCGWMGELRILDDHLTICGYALLHCPNKCMENKKEVYLLRRDLYHHLKDNCPNRQHQCPHCKDTGRYLNITTIHLETCQMVKIPCPNTDCKTLVPRCKLADHRSKCWFEKVSCKYSEIGCQKKPLRKDFQQHIEDDTFHLHLAIETVNKQQREINELQKEMKVDKEEQKIMSNNIIAGHAGPCVFNMTKFNQQKSSNQEWYSPPFYTHPGGYKMCIRVYANGNSEGAGTHVSVFAYLMKGKNDDNLPWPFTGTVAFTLLNQLADKNHHTCTVSFPPDSDTNRRVVDSEMSPRGYGQPKFISHNQFDCDAAHYLKNDCLYFRIEVKAAEPTKPWLICTI